MQKLKNTSIYCKMYVLQWLAFCLPSECDLTMKLYNPIFKFDPRGLKQALIHLDIIFCGLSYNKLYTSAILI